VRIALSEDADDFNDADLRQAKESLDFDQRTPAYQRSAHSRRLG